MMATGKTFEVVEVGYLKANGTVSSDTLEAGEVGFIAASIKNVSDTRVGDTVHHRKGRRGRSSAWLQAGQPHGILRYLPRGRRKV